MDEKLPAPGRADPLRFVRADKYYDARFDGVEKKILDLAAAGKIGYYQAQHILWGIRGIDQGSNYSQSLIQRPDLMRIMEEASPGSVRKFVEIAQKVQQQKEVSAAIGRVVGSIAGNNRLVAAILQDLLDPNTANSAIEREIAQLNRPVANRWQYRVPTEASFSKLADGVYAQSVAEDALFARAAIVNMTNRPFEFRLSDWIAEPALPQQRVAFTSITSQEAVSYTPDYSDFSISEFSKSAGEALFKKALGASDKEAAGKLAIRVGQWFANKFPISNPYLKAIAVHAPIVGNVISLSEVFDETKSAPERILAAFGSIPGYGSLLRVAGSASKLSSIAQKAIQSSPSVFKAVDRTEILRDAADIGMLAVDDKNTRLWEATTNVVGRLVESQKLA